MRVSTTSCLLVLMMALAMCASASEAQAQAKAEPVETVNPIQGYDYALMPLAMMAGSTVGVVVGAGLGVAFCQDTDEAFACLGSLALGGLVGVAVGTPLSVWLYADERELDGSVIGGVVGYASGVLLGTLLYAGIASLPDSQIYEPFYGNGLLLSSVSFVLIPSVMGSLGYLGLAEASNAPVSTSLFHVAPGEGLSLGMPVVNVSLEQEDMRVSMPLLSGQF